MNTQIYYGISVLILSLLVLVVGMIKPKLILLWMDKPGRMAIALIASGIFMAGAVLFGEGNKLLQQEKAQKTQQQSVKPASDLPVPAQADVQTPAKQ